MMKFCLCLHIISELCNLFSLVPIGKLFCFQCYFRQLIIYLALKNVKMTIKYSGTDFCPLKPEIGRFQVLSDFVFNNTASVNTRF